MSRIRSLAIKTPIHTILRIKQAQRGRQNIVYRNQILTVVDSSGKTIDQVRVKNATSASTSAQKIIKQQFPPFIQQITKGYNLLIMSLGTTGSGKQSLFGTIKNRGLIATLVEQLCMDIQSLYYATTHQNLDFFFQIRAIEIFQERVMDLFNSNLPTSCTMKDNVWDGVVLERSTAVKSENYLDFMEKLEQAYKNRQNLLNLISGSTSRTSSIITVSLFQQWKDKGKRSTLCSKIMFAQLPGLQILKNSQLDLRVREANKALRGVVAFSSLIKQLSDDNNQVSPLYEASNLTFALKQFLGSNSLCITFANVINQDPQGTLKTLACMKNISRISQYPIVNTGQCLGLMYRIRTDLASLKVPEIRQKLSEKTIKQERLMNQNSNNDRIRAEDDYKRILQKYKQSKSKLQDTIRKKSQLQLLLIRSQQQKLQLSKTLVQIQIQNTKLMQQAQFKQYNMSKKNHKLQSAILKGQSEKTKSNQNITNLNQYLAQLQQDKRDLQIQFIALKKNYLLSQKQLEQSRKQTQIIQVDYINLTNQNKYLQDQLFKGTRDQRQKYQMEQINKYHTQKSDWIQRENQYKRQLDELRREMLRSSKQNNYVNIGASKASSKSNNVELENQRQELYNRLKLSERKVDQLEEHLRILNEDIQEYKQQNSSLSQSLNTTAGYYKNKLEQLIRNKQGIGLNKAMNEHLANQNEDSSKRITQLNKKAQILKQKNRGLRIYAMRLKSLAEQYMPRGLQVPVSQQDDIDQIQQQQIIRLNSRIRELENQLRMKGSQQSGKDRSITNQMLKQEINFLKESRVGTPASQAEKIRRQQNELKQQNRKLTMMLKDSNKLEIASILKQNESLKNEIDRMRSKDSVSPVSNDQKLIYYEKHIKKLEKQRSQLLVRVTMAEEQLKMYQNHYEKKRG